MSEYPYQYLEVLPSPMLDELRQAWIEAHEAKSVHFEYIKSIGGKGCYHGDDGEVLSVIFDGPVPDGWKKPQKRGSVPYLKNEIARAALNDLPRWTPLKSIINKYPFPQNIYSENRDYSAGLGGWFLSRLYRPCTPDFRHGRVFLSNVPHLDYERARLEEKNSCKAIFDHEEFPDFVTLVSKAEVDYAFAEAALKRESEAA